MKPVRGLDRYPTREEIDAKLAERLPRRPDVKPPLNLFFVGKDTERRFGEALLRATALALHSRFGDQLRLVLNGPPRTKKNGTTLGIRQRPAYRRYRDAIVAALEPLRLSYGSPILPGNRREGNRYNLAAVFYVDRKGEAADLCGLLQGLSDALENADVVENDWVFRTFDGTRVVFGDSRPRVELTISPL
jgi:hypothetical protein